MHRIVLPAHSWRPRDYQEKLWSYLKSGGKLAEAVWHRRAGKDELALHHAACSMVEEPGNYWHMLPLANQVRKAIWEAVNSHTGRRRIDEVFPDDIFEKRNTDMFIRCKANASTWQCLGSDNYGGAIGSSAKGITYSEWAQANPTARGYLRPMVVENNGYQLFITTPRGKNHAHSTFKAAQKNPNAFAQLLTVHDTQCLTPQQLKEELLEYVSTYGEAMGLALYEQEYECSWDAAILGAYYGSEFKKMDQQGRICHVPYDPMWPVHVAMDIGYDDDTAIWWFQVVGGEPRIIESYFNSGQDVDHYCSVLLGRTITINFIHDKLVVEAGDSNEWEHRQAYQYASINLPHDAQAKTLAAKGKSVEEQFAAVFGWSKVQIVPTLSVADGIIATRKLLQRSVLDEDCDGIEACRQYHREWDDEKKMFRDKPEHDWTSHYADALRYLAIVWNEDKLPKEAQPVRFPQHRTINEIVESMRKRRINAD